MKSSFNQYIKWALFLGLGLTLVVIVLRYTAINSPSNSLKGHETTKEQQWQIMEQKVASWGDGLGLGIDPGIKKAVIVLNLLGFKTEGSCQGHIDWGLPYPWIDFNTQDEEINALHIKRQDIYKLIDEKEAEIQKKHPHLSLGQALRKEQSKEVTALYKQRHLLNDTMDKLSKLKLLPLNNLMTEFYKKHSIDRDKMLAFHSLNRIHSLGGDWQITRDDNERLRKLKEYQEEMKSFTDFLTRHYFEKQD